MNPPIVPFGQFKLVHEVAVGGMGEIFLASDTQMSRPVAIKRVLEQFRTRPDVSRMFEVEATIMSVLRHPNIVRVFESGELDGIFYIAMEYIHGKNLRQLVDRSREVGEALPPFLAIEIISAMARALSYAHGMKGRSGRPMGLVHRDVNPSNLLIGYDGAVKLIDFGIVQTDDELAPEDLEPKGKFAYMSPEQTRGGRVDLRSDIFSLGICLYEALTLYNPFIHEARGQSAVDAIQSIDPAPVSDRNHRLAPFDPVVRRALAKDPAKRFQDGEELAVALEEVGQSFRHFMPLAAFMSDLFEAQKAEEDAILDRVELASSSTVVLGAATAPPSPGPPPLPSPSSRERHSEPVTPVEESPLVFFALVALIAVITGVTAFSVYRGVIRDRLGSESLVTQEPPSPPALAVGRDADASEATAPDNVAAKDSNLEREGEARADGLKEPEEREATKGGAPAVVIEPNEDYLARAALDSSAEPRSPLGTLSVSSDPSVRMAHGEERVTRSDDLELLEPTGTLTLGRGRHVTRDPFAVTLRYTVEGDRLSLQVQSEPWAIVRGPGGVTVGRTPARYSAKAGTTSLELANARERRLMRVVLRFRPKP